MHELSTVANTLQLPGCTLLRNGLQIEHGLSDGQLEGIGKTLNALGHCGLWWWGDYLCHVGTEKGTEYADAVLQSSYDYGSLRVAKWVCNLLPLLSRDNEMSYTHHREALVECDGRPADALAWVTKAREEGWTVAEMRKAIRESSATYKKSDRDKGQASVYDYIRDLKLWLKTGLETATPELREQLKADLLEIVAKL